MPRGLRPDPGPPLGADFYDRPVTEVAPELLNKLLVVATGEFPTLAGRIVEVEAYGGEEDPASHAHRGPTRRNLSMFGPPGTLYVYFTYGMHWCANAVCGPEGVGAAVLIRALAPPGGFWGPAEAEVLGQRRPRASRTVDLTNGPAKLCQAFGIDAAGDGLDLTRSDSPVYIGADGTPPPVDPVVTTRVGIRAGTDLPWRWHVATDPHVSR